MVSCAILFMQVTDWLLIHNFHDVVYLSDMNMTDQVQ